LSERFGVFVEITRTRTFLAGWWRLARPGRAAEHGLGEVHMAGASRSARDQVGAAIGSEIRRADAQRRIARWGT
jgi:hypothetical protein